MGALPAHKRALLHEKVPAAEKARRLQIFEHEVGFWTN